MEDEILKDLLIYSEPCGKCYSTGKWGENGEDTCPDCNGTGVLMDSRIPNILLKYYPEARRITMAKCAEEIYQLIGDKLVESYKRGLHDHNKNNQQHDDDRTEDETN